ncbi:MAG TPA: chromate resistance protein ChrB domain-containing protein [Vicinamibacteria bacterium]
MLPAVPRWLVLIHQIPPRPNYLRVKIGRRLQALGAVAVKNSVYVLPRSDPSLEDFQWVRREIVAGRGEATICESRFLEGNTDGDVEGLFRAAREADYASLAREARDLERAVARGGRGALESSRAMLARLRKRLSEIQAIDFFGASGKEGVEGLLAGVDARLRPARAAKSPTAALPARGLRGRTWVTRGGIHVDRMASAWLIRRFVDRQARFKFAPGHAHAPRRGELRFDMPEAEFTHEGDHCTFEVLVRRFGAGEPALVHLGEIVHDIDLKDGKFARPEAPGVERLIAGIVMRHPGDEARLKEASTAFDSLYESFRRRK